MLAASTVLANGGLRLLLSLWILQAAAALAPEYILLISGAEVAWRPPGSATLRHCDACTNKYVITATLRRRQASKR